MRRGISRVQLAKVIGIVGLVVAAALFGVFNSGIIGTGDTVISALVPESGGELRIDDSDITMDVSAPEPFTITVEGEVENTGTEEKKFFVEARNPSFLADDLLWESSEWSLGPEATKEWSFEIDLEDVPCRFYIWTRTYKQDLLCPVPIYSTWQACESPGVTGGEGVTQKPVTLDRREINIGSLSTSHPYRSC